MTDQPLRHALEVIDSEGFGADVDADSIVKNAASDMLVIRPALRGLIDDIDAFDDTCQNAEYTDTGDAWNLLNSIRKHLADVAGEPTVTPTACDYTHYDEHEVPIDHPADWWVQDANDVWHPICSPCLPEWWHGGEREGEPFTVYPIDTRPPGAVKKESDR